MDNYKDMSKEEERTIELLNEADTKIKDFQKAIADLEKPDAATHRFNPPGMGNKTMTPAEKDYRVMMLKKSIEQEKTTVSESVEKTIEHSSKEIKDSCRVRLTNTLYPEKITDDDRKNEKSIDQSQSLMMRDRYVKYQTTSTGTSKVVTTEPPINNKPVPEKSKSDELSYSERYSNTLRFTKMREQQKTNGRDITKAPGKNRGVDMDKD